MGRYSRDEVEHEVGAGYLEQLDEEPVYRNQDLDGNGFRVWEKVLDTDEGDTIIAYYYLPKDACPYDIHDHGPLDFDIKKG